MPNTNRRTLGLIALPLALVPAAFIYFSSAKKPAPYEPQVLAASATPAPNLKPQPKSARSASQVLAGSARAYQKLRSLSLSARIVGAGGQPGREINSILVAWKKPNLLRVESQVQGDTRRFFLSPAVFHSTSTLAKKTRFVRIVPEPGSGASTRAAELALSGADPGGFGLAPMLANNKPFGAFRAHLKSLAMRAPTEAEKGEIADECDIVVATVQPPSAPLATIEYFIARRDSLLRRVSLRVAPDDEAATPLEISTTFSSVRANAPLPDSTFRFSPRARDRRVASLDAHFDDRLIDGARPFDFQAVDLNRKPVSLASYKGKVWLLDFWATWCPPCIAAAPAITRTYKKYRARGFDVLGVSLDKSPQALRAFTAPRGMAWRQVWASREWDDPLVKRFGVTALPVSLLIGRDGKIIAVDPDPSKLESMVKEAL